MNRDIAPGKEGWTRHQEKYREASFDGADGVVIQDQQSFLNLIYHPVCAIKGGFALSSYWRSHPSWPGCGVQIRFWKEGTEKGTEPLYTISKAASLAIKEEDSVP